MFVRVAYFVTGLGSQQDRHLIMKSLFSSGSAKCFEICPKWGDTINVEFYLVIAFVWRWFSCVSISKLPSLTCKSWNNFRVCSIFCLVTWQISFNVWWHLAIYWSISLGDYKRWILLVSGWKLEFYLNFWSNNMFICLDK